MAVSSPGGWQTAVDGQQYASGEWPLGPQGRVVAPAPVVGGVGLVLAYEVLGGAHDVADVALLCASDVAVALEGHLVAFDAYDTVVYIFSGSNLCQHGIAHLRSAGGAGEHNLVAAVFEEGAHAEASHAECGIVAVGDESFHLSEENLVGEFYGVTSRTCHRLSLEVTAA